MAGTFDAYFSKLAAGPRAAGVALAAAIRRTGPQLTSSLYRGHPAWHGRAWVFSVVGHSAHCNLQIVQGAALADDYPDRIQGTGKSLRHVKVRGDDDIDCELEAIIAAAIALDAAAPPPASRGRR